MIGMLDHMFEWSSMLRKHVELKVLQVRRLPLLFRGYPRVNRMPRRPSARCGTPWVRHRGESTRAAQSWWSSGSRVWSPGWFSWQGVRNDRCGRVPHGNLENPAREAERGSIVCEELSLCCEWGRLVRKLLVAGVCGY